MARRWQRRASALGGVMLTLTLAAPAHAAITATRDAAALAGAMITDPSTLRGAAFVSIPADDPGRDNDNPAGTADAPLAGQPTHGSTFALLSSGDVLLTDKPNDSGSSGADLNGQTPPGRGDTAFDVTVLRVDVTVPAQANCLSLTFKFLSDEYPEFVNSNYNDAFIAEVDTSDWTTNQSTITAPNNFAFDPEGKVISINATGDTSVDPQDSAGTTFDAATQVLIARKVISAGDHSVYLSIFDQGDQIFDAVAMIDALSFVNVPASSCQSGAVVNESTPPTTVTTAPIPPCTPNGQIEFQVTDQPRGAGPRAVHYRLDGGPEQVLTTTGNPGKALLTVPPGSHSIEYWGEDRNGNQEVPHKTATVVVDPNQPTVTVAQPAGTTFTQGQLAQVDVKASDDISGLATDPSGKKTVDTNTPGNKTATFTAVDRCGNQATATFTYVVRRLTAGSVIPLPSAKKCVSRRNFRIRLRQPRGIRIASALVAVNGQRVRTLRGRRVTAPIDLRRFVGRRRITVSITVVTTSGRVLSAKRRYRTCTKKRRSGRAPRL